MTADVRRWHHAVLTTYGTWLPGDPRGFRTRHHRTHVDGDCVTPPPAGSYEALQRHNRDSLTQAPVVLSADMRPIVGTAIVEKLVNLGAWVLCIAVSGEHAHLLVKLPPQSAREWCGIAKRHATFELRNVGWRHRLWGTRTRSTVILSRRHQVNAYKYILRHAGEGAWIGVWKKEGGPMSA